MRPIIKVTHTHTLPDFKELPIFTKIYYLYNRATHIIGAFPKTKRYTLGQEIDQTILRSIELFLSIPTQENKLKSLELLSIKIDLLKVLIRLAKDNQCMKEKDYLALQELLQEIGKMLGGWIRASKAFDKRLSEKPTSSSD